jgi:flavorubredoxin
MVNALDSIKDLDTDMLTTAHGPGIDGRIVELRELYIDWSTVVKPNP